MPNPCLTCSSPQLEAIDGMIAAGHVSLRKIAAMFGVSKDSLARHRNHGHVVGLDPNAPTETRARFEGDDSTAIMRSEAMALLRSVDPSKVGPAILIARMNGVRLLADAIDRAEPPQRTEARIEDIAGFPDLIAEWFRLTERHPKIRGQMLAALERHSAALAGRVEETP